MHHITVIYHRHQLTTSIGIGTWYLLQNGPKVSVNYGIDFTLPQYTLPLRQIFRDYGGITIVPIIVQICIVCRTLDAASDHILSFLDARDTPITDTATTYKSLRDTLDAIVDSGYFSRPVHDSDDHNSKENITETNGHDTQGVCSNMLSTTTLSVQGCTRHPVPLVRISGHFFYQVGAKILNGTRYCNRIFHLLNEYWCWKMYLFTCN